MNVLTMMSVYSHQIKIVLLLIKILQNVRFVKEVMSLITMIFVSSFRHLHVISIANSITYLLQWFLRYFICSLKVKDVTNVMTLK